MQLTNLHNLPEPFVAAIRAQAGDYRAEGDFHATQLAAPVQISALRRRYGGELTEDAMDRIWVLFGSCVHDKLAKDSGQAEGWNSEFRLKGQVVHGRDAYTVSGQVDAFHPASGHLLDYKTGSLHGSRDGVKPEHRTQVLVYAWLLWRNGLAVKRITLLYLYKDWSQSQAAHGKRGYPDYPVECFDVPVPDMAQLEAAIPPMVVAQLRADALTDLEIATEYPCSDEDRWARGEAWAVMPFPGAARAMRVFDDPAAAEAFLQQSRSRKPKAVIEHRPPTAVRCESYCPVASYCEQWQAELRDAG